MKKIISAVLVLILIVSFIPLAFAEDGPVTDTAYGQVRGKYFQGGECYYGIPYAKATTGKLRFMPPQAPDKWEGVLDATVHSKDPLQSGYSASKQSEDSLRLNIWIPDNDAEEPLAVMFWIYGGSYAMGGINESYYDMETMARDTGCIIVSANYRLNVCGFLDLRYAVPGATVNNGLRDIVFALKWVNENIENFGGDKSNVTVFGQSAGAALAQALLCVPSAESYFHKVISQSACGDSFYSPAQAREISEVWLKLMGNPSAEELVSMSPRKLLSCNGILDVYAIVKNGINCTFNPVIDGEFVTCHVSELPKEKITKKLLIGTTKDEASLFLFFVVPPLTYLPLAQNCAMPDYHKELRKTVTEDFRFMSTKALITLTTERMYRYPLTTLADNFSESTQVYAYRYDYEPSLVKLLGLGAFHATEIPLLFDSHLNIGSSKLAVFNNSEDKEVGKRMRTYWGNFAKYGCPDESWKVYSKTQRETLIIESNDYMANDPYKERMMLYKDYVSPWNR